MQVVVSLVAGLGATASPSPQASSRHRVTTTRVERYGQLNKTHPNLTGEAPESPDVLVKVVRTIYSLPILGRPGLGNGPTGSLN
jgi:hypothetical protein